MITVEPYLEIDRSRVSCSPTVLASQPIAMSGLKFTWGRDDYFGEADPISATVRLWDATGTWATRIRESRAVGVELAVKYQLPSGVMTMFRGSISSAVAGRTGRVQESTGRDIWEITITAVDPTAALGNVYPYPGVLQPTDTMEQRKEWLKGLCSFGGVVISEIEYQQGYRESLTSPVEVGNDSALDLMRAFFDGMSRDAFAYDPQSNRVIQCERMDWSFSTYLASFDDSRGAVMVTASDAQINGRTRPGVALSGCTLIVDPKMQIAASTNTDINIVETTWYDQNDQWRGKVSARSAVANGQPRRLLKNDTWLTADWAIELQLQSAWDRARAEGRWPRHPEITYRPGKGFATERLAKWWLQLWEDARPAFINGDMAHHWIMSGQSEWPPLLSPLGGTVEYDAERGWSISLIPQWMKNRITVQPMTWTLLQQIRFTSQAPAVPWWWGLTGQPMPPRVSVGSPTPERDVRWGAPDPEGHEYRFDESTTWADLRHLDRTAREIKDVLQ